MDPVQAGATAARLAKQLLILAPEQDETVLQKAGCSDIDTFYIGLGFRGGGYI